MELSEFAAEMIKEMDAPQVEGATPPESEQQPQQLPDEDTLEVEALQEELDNAEVEQNQDVETQEQSGEVEEEPWVPSSFSELAEALDVSVDDLSSIQLNTKVDGVEGTATLAEVLKNYQLDKSITQRSEKFAHERKAFEEQSKKLQEQYQAHIDAAEARTKAIDEQLSREITAIDWDQLRAENPAEWSARRQEYMERIGQIEQVKQEMIKEREAQTQQQQEEYKKQYAKYLEENTKNLINTVPELKNDAVRKEKLTELKSYLLNNGVTQEEVGQISDYRTIVLGLKAMAYDKMQQTADIKKAQAKKQPKFTKPGVRKTQAAVQQDNIDKRVKTLKQSGKAKDFAALLLESGNI